MHHNLLDTYRHRHSAVHRLDARVKLVLAVAFILVAALAPIGAWPVYILLLALVLGAEILSELGPVYVVGRASLVLPFVLAALPVIFTARQGDLNPLLTAQVGPWTLTATAAGVERFTSIALKSWLSAQAAIVLAASTPFPDLLLAMRALRVPSQLVALFALMWRYLFVLVDEATRLMRARAARSGAARSGTARSRAARSGTDRGRAGGTLAWRARVAGGMAGSLFVRSFERSDRIYAAMASRGFDGEVRGLQPPPMAHGQRAVLFGGLSTLAALAMLGLLLGG